MALVTMPHSLRKAEILRYEKGGGAHGFHSSRNFNQQSFRFLPHTAGARCQGREAEDRLGLVKMDPSQVTYVRLEDESVIERAAGTADKFFAGIKTAALSLLGSFDP